jgi:cytochrome c oxidase assembly factor CtaG
VIARARSSSPIDTLAEKLFWVHMIQHVMLLTIAAPLIVLGAPVELDLAPAAARLSPDHCQDISALRWCAPLRALGRCFSRPIRSGSPST